MHIILFILFINIIIFLGILGMIKQPFFALVGGLLGFIFSAIAQTDGLLTLSQVYNATTSLWIDYTVVLGYFVYIPLFLTIMDFLILINRVNI